MVGDGVVSVPSPVPATVPVIMWGGGEAVDDNNTLYSRQWRAQDSFRREAMVPGARFVDPDPL